MSGRHPLFPLLALLFEKCEQATQGSECITSASFDVDIENFVHQQEQDHKPFFSEDPELDNLVNMSLVALFVSSSAVYLLLKTCLLPVPKCHICTALCWHISTVYFKF